MPLSEGNFASATAITMGNIARPGCLTQCGNLTVQYPFGIGKGCSLDESFELTCNLTYKPPKLFIGSGNIEIYSISDSEMRIYNRVAYKCYNASGNVTDELDAWTNLETTPFTFSQKNKFTVIGCDDFALIGGTNGAEFTSGCLGACSNANDVPADGYCSGIGCCQTAIPKGLKFYQTTVLTIDNHTAVQSFNPCGLAFLGEEDSFQFGGAHDLYNATEFYDRTIASVPVVVDWVIGGNWSCAQASTECKGNSVCSDADIGGYRCSCNKGYEGNPYLDPGCQGSYNYTCLPGNTGDARTVDGCRPVAKNSKFPAMVFCLALVFGFVAMLSGITGICLGIRKRKLIKLREKFFEQNGGVFLKQKLKAPGASDNVTIFSTQQLRKATDNYSEERIVGRGGYVVVYKGILQDERVVAIKKSKLVDGTQAEQFINEVLILTQVIHRNVVKLLGFCLEEEVPILVYEFISNNTLFYHIHHGSGGVSWLSWENRLRVAAEAAFGVVLAELITGQKPLSPDRINVEKNLATHFLNSVKENRFLQIVEPRVLREATVEQLQAVRELTRRCLHLVGENRPTMKEVAMMLEGFRKFTTHPWVHQETSESRSLILEVKQSDVYSVLQNPI
ncbi:unnamed protein product [Lactuca virosa]|uniref:Protein kinase domain-containing protein n=1 Tax=Lactuca virosa TaxID=75947 RepID=A0AAU9P7B5_9ASTR|nr:unnamed protein product [Lactuca virosa]